MRSDGGHLVGFSPIDLTAQGSRLLGHTEYRHDGVVTEERMPGGCQLGHYLWIGMSLRKPGIYQLHLIYGRD